LVPLPSVNQPEMSTTRSTVPPALPKSTRPPWPTPTTTRFATVWAGPKLRFEAQGRATPCGQAVTYPKAVGLVTVTFRTTADTPEAGTPARPRTPTETTPPAPMVVDPPNPVR